MWSVIIIRSSGIFPCYSPSPAEIPVYVSHFKTSQFFSFISFIPFRLLLLQMCYCRPVITALLPASPGLLLLLFILPARCIIQIFFFFFFFSLHCWPYNRHISSRTRELTKYCSKRQQQQQQPWWWCVYVNVSRSFFLSCCGTPAEKKKKKKNKKKGQANGRG